MTQPALAAAATSGKEPPAAADARLPYTSNSILSAVFWREGRGSLRIREAAGTAASSLFMVTHFRKKAAPEKD